MRNSWKTLSSKVMYKNPWLEVVEDKVVMPNGKEGIYGYINKLPGVFIVAQDDDGGIFLIKEYRYVLKQEILQLPSGTMEPDLNILELAEKELLEETGIQAKHFKHIGKYFVAPGHETTESNTVLATGLDTSRIDTNRQEGNESILEVKKYSIAEIRMLIKNNTIKSGLTLAALNQYFCYKSI